MLLLNSKKGVITFNAPHVGETKHAPHVGRTKHAPHVVSGRAAPSAIVNDNDDKIVVLVYFENSAG